MPHPLPSPRHRFTRQPIWERLQTTVMVILFTGLIWWNANETVRASRVFSVRLTVAKVADHSVRITSADEFNVTVSGSKRLLDAFADSLRSRRNALEYRLSDSDVGEPQEALIRTSTLVLENTDLLKDSGLTIDEATPPDAVFSVDRLVDSQMPVEPDFGHLKVEGATALPSSVRVTMPQRERGRHPGVLRPQVEELVREWRAGHPDELTFSISVPILPPRGVEAVDPPNVTVGGTIRQVLATQSKGPVEVLPALPRTVQEQLVVQPSQENGFRVDVQVRGPIERLADLQATQIQAYLDIFTEDRPGEDITRRIVVVLPKGFELNGDAPEVTFRLQPRSDESAQSP